MLTSQFVPTKHMYLRNLIFGKCLLELFYIKVAFCGDLVSVSQKFMIVSTQGEMKVKVLA